MEKQYIRQSDLARKKSEATGRNYSKQRLHNNLYKFDTEIVYGEKMIVLNEKVTEFLAGRK